MLCDELYKNIYGDYVAFTYSHQGWSSKNILCFDKKDDKDDTKTIFYAFRTGDWKNGRMISFQQYRNEGKVKGDKDAEKDRKIKNATEIRDLIEEICPDLRDKLEYNDKNKDSKNFPHQNHIFKLSIEEKEKEKTCEMLRKFISELQKKFENEPNVTVCNEN